MTYLLILFANEQKYTSHCQFL